MKKQTIFYKHSKSLQSNREKMEISTDIKQQDSKWQMKYKHILE